MIHERHINAVHVHPIVERLTAVRMSWQLSLEYVAGRIPCRRDTLRKYETGIQQPSLKLLDRWADVLGYETSLRPTSVNHRVQNNIPTENAYERDRP